MTLIVGCIGFTLAMLAALFCRELSVAESSKVRAQTAADAAALAAVAESTPYGTGACELVARRYAELNGGRLIHCACEPRTASAEVEVEVGEASARARAVLDAALLAPQRVTFDHAGLDPLLASAVERLLSAADGRVSVVSGYRSPARQTMLWSEALRRYGSVDAANDWVAPPGDSVHELGLAVDLGGDLELATLLVDRLDLPLYRPLPNEPWHFELYGPRGT